LPGIRAFELKIHRNPGNPEAKEGFVFKRMKTASIYGGNLNMFLVIKWA